MWEATNAFFSAEKTIEPTILRFKEKKRGKMAGVTGLEPATSGVTGQRSNQLSYTPFTQKKQWWAMKDLNLRPSRCKRDALPLS